MICLTFIWIASKIAKSDTMVRLTPDSLSQKIAYVAVFFGISALVLACVGIATPKWYTSYTSFPNLTYTEAGHANFFYACGSSSGQVINCVNRNGSLTNYPGYSSSYTWMGDYFQRMQNAGALCIVGIIFLFFGTLATLIMALIYFQTWVNLLPPVLLFLACLFMLAGMAEGSRYFLYNDYSSQLYQTAHLLTMFAMLLSALAAGRIHFSRWTEAGRGIGPK